MSSVSPDNVVSPLTRAYSRSAQHIIKEVSFDTSLSDKMKEQKDIQEYMLTQAAYVLARQLIEMDDIWEIDTSYDILTLSTRIRHRIRVLTTEK